VVRLYRTTVSSEFRQLVHPAAPGRSHWDGIFHPTGRFFLSDALDGLSIWDAHTGKELPQPARGRFAPIGFDFSGALLTADTAGFERWPVEDEGNTLGRLRYGPPQRFRTPASPAMCGCSADGRVVAIPCLHLGAMVWHHDRPGQMVQLGPQPDVRTCAVSPDGRWVATGSHDGTGNKAKVWEADSGKLVRELPVRGICRVGFSPDGRWLATNGGGCRLWEVGSWRPALAPGDRFFAFAADGKLLAVGGDTEVVRLIDPVSGKEYARLTTPDETFLTWPFSFSRDGMLAVQGYDSKSFHLWDLQAVRRYLKTLDLDWDLPPYPRRTDTGPPPQVELVLDPPGK
jgi:WD40 repeat protein